MKQAILWTLRIIVGLLFIFSGLVKANDPMGLTYKTQEFFEKMHLGFLHDFTLVLSIIMIILEVLAGVALLIGYKMKQTSILLMVLILFFTYLTAFALFVKAPDGSPIIKECGCFGDCIPLSNMETFVKNLVLLAFIFILFYFRHNIRRVFSKKVGTSIIIGTVLVVLLAQFFVLRHLPFVDCLPYKVGNNLPSLMTVPESQQAVIENVFIYEKDGVKKEFDIDHLPDDTWTFVDRKDIVIKEGTAEPKVKDFVISDINGADVTSFVLESTVPLHMWIIRDLSKSKGKGVKLASQLFENSIANNEEMILVCANTPEEMQKYKAEYGLPQEIEMCSLDGTTLKTMMRTNEGMVTLKEGTVTEKYALADFKKHIK